MKFHIRAFILPLLLLAGSSFALDRVVGANATLDVEPGARSAALGSATMAVDGDYLGLVSNPYQLSNVEYAWFSFSHTSYYEDTKYDFASVALPLAEGQGLGVSFARFGASDIPYIKEGEPIPEGSDYKTLSIADYVFSVTFGKKWSERLDLGLGFHGLYRDMDQTGWGFRADLGARYRLIDNLYVSAFLEGFTSSATTWESGETEFSDPELYLALNYGIDVPYLYGKLQLYWQAAGFFHEESRYMDFEEDEEAGGALWKDPLDWLSGGRGGVEFLFDFGLSLRAGLSSFTTLESVTAGAGLVIAKFVRIDYAFESHPVLSPVHRVSVSISPYLFAHAPKSEPKRRVQKTSVLSEEEPVEDEEEASQEDSVKPLASPSEKSANAETSTAQPEEVLEEPSSGGTYWEE
ncbi:MAG: hypothetical protein HUK21_12080 [Fibrobacteraceae bacterium]|nr:hypothetical protein [Fibrobacteraceae bacterium]